MRIGIIGHFGGNEVFNDGQTVKTITLFKALERRKPDDMRIDKADTYYIKRNPIRFVCMLLRCLCFDKKIIVLLSENGRNVLFPVLCIFAKYFRKDIYHYAIGGQLGNEVLQKKKWKRYINSFRGNWMESISLVKALEAEGISNTIYVPNFKSLTVLTEAELTYCIEEPYRFCTFSRVMPEKGIEDAIRAITEINRYYGRRRVLLDIYGPVDNGYETCFAQILVDNPDSKYCGIVDPNCSVEILKDYFALLFPTYWKGEAMPGTVIDAYCSGIPIIARWWPVCDELIENGITGVIYPQDQPDKLIECIEAAIANPNAFNKMKLKCLKKGSSYCEEAVIKQIAMEMGVPFF